MAFVYTSTSSAIHDNVSELVDADESLPVLRYPAQRHVYTLTKVEAEDEILAAKRQDGDDSSMLTVSIRPATAFGTRDAVHLSTITRTLRCDKAKRILGNRPRVGVYGGLEECSKWFVEEAKSVEQAKKPV